MKKVFVCSPLKGDLELNIEKARNYCKHVIGCGHIPYAPHVFFTQFLDDTVEEERKLGMLGGIEFLKVCDAIFVFSKKGEESYGMKAEIKYAEENNIPITYINPDDILK